MNGTVKREFHQFLVIFFVAILLWGLVYSSIKARYDHFSELGTIENFSLRSSLDGSDAPQLKTLKKELNQFGNSGFLWSEAAFHYRTTLMYAVKWYQETSVLQNDRWQEFPDGINAWSEYPIFMEPIFGYLYKWFASKSQNLIQFLMIVLPIFHVLLLFPLFLLAKELSGSSRYALISILIFSTCSITFSPLISSFYVKETLSWFLFSIFLIGHFKYLRHKKSGWLGIGGIGLFLFLISWHLAPFLTIPICLVGSLGLVWGSPDFHYSENTLLRVGKWERKLKTHTFQPALYSLVFLAVGFFPWFKGKGFIVGWPFLTVALWLFLALVFASFPASSKTKKIRFYWLAGGLLLVLCLGTIGSHFFGDYSHVNGLIWYRILHGFQKPTDPTEIPFAIRVFWVAPFSSPRWLAIKTGLGINGILLVLATVWVTVKSFRKNTSLFEKSLTWCAMLYLVAFVLVERLAPLFVFFSAVLVSQLGVLFENFVARKNLRTPLFLVFSMFPLFTLFYSLEGMVQLSLANLRGQDTHLTRLDKELDSARSTLFDWIRTNTPGPGSSAPEGISSFVGDIGVSPQLLLYTGRPIVLNSQFENQKIRSRYSKYLSALFSENESELVAFFAKYKINYVFINRDWALANGRNTPKYYSGRTGKSPLSCNISRLHFFPYSLPHFQPVYENRFFRVFRFHYEKENNSNPTWARTYSRWWNLANFSHSRRFLENSSKDRKKLQELDRFFPNLLEKLGKVYLTREQKWKADHPNSDSRVSLAKLQQDLAKARFTSTTEGLVSNPDSKVENLELKISRRLEEPHPETGISLGKELFTLLHGSPNSSPGALEKILPFECSPEEYSLIGDLAVLLGDFELAGELFGKSSSIFPKPSFTKEIQGSRPTEVQELLWEKSVLYMIAAGDFKKGKGFARYCAEHVCPGSPRRPFFIKAGKITLD